MTREEMHSIPSKDRYEGMLIEVESNLGNTLYELRHGITNDDWMRVCVITPEVRAALGEDLITMFTIDAGSTGKSIPMAKHVTHEMKPNIALITKDLQQMVGRVYHDPSLGYIARITNGKLTRVARVTCSGVDYNYEQP